MCINRVSILLTVSNNNKKISAVDIEWFGLHLSSIIFFGS